MVKHTQTICRQFADELFECVWPFCDIKIYIRTNIIQSMCRLYVSNDTRKRMFTICRWYNIISSMQSKWQHAFISSIEKDIHFISRWSSDTNLIFKIAKTKVMVITTLQMSKHHQLKEEKLNVKCNNVTLERVSEWKLLDITLREHFHLDNHISKLLKKLLLLTFYAEKVKMIYDITNTKTTDRIVDILQTRLLQQFIHWLTTVPNQTFIKTTKGMCRFRTRNVNNI